MTKFSQKKIWQHQGRLPGLSRYGIDYRNAQEQLPAIAINYFTLSKLSSINNLKCQTREVSAKKIA
ncbi:hypothetical protein A6769_31415 [Nostoc punctiforme NIES-2108]|uniref:Uncharacterized protein n=1 Tax=Nostoc punctiforme NIES-2108 TaxID=1356359 RepID=A0A367R6W4_NOSPU|nr:hypothetical protein A6769_31415 [Nostoc punctiforme NIES-2108]